MPLYVKAILILSIYFPAIIGLYKIKNISLEYRPLLILIWLWCITDTIGLIVYEYYQNAFVNNIHYLFESQLALWQFYQWRFFKKTKYLTFSALFGVAWMSEMHYIYVNELITLTYFVCIYSFLFVIFSIMVMGNIGTHKTQFSWKPIYDICSAFILYFTFTSLLSVFLMDLFNLNEKAFIRKTYFVMYIILFICNIMYGRAILRLQKIL